MKASAEEYRVYITTSSASAGEQDRLHCVDSDQNLLWSVDDPVAGAQQSRSILLHTNDLLYLPAWDGARYQRYDKTAGAFLNTVGIKASPSSMAFGPNDGYLYVIHGEGTWKGLRRYNPETGADLGQWIAYDTDGMTGLAFGPHDDYLYVCGGTKIKRYNAAGTLVEPVFATAGAALIHLIWRDGYLYASDLGTGTEPNGTIRRFDSSGNHLGTIITPGAGGLRQAWGFDFAPNGDILIGDYHPEHVVRRFDASGTFIDVFFVAPDDGWPWAVAIEAPPPDFYAYFTGSFADTGEPDRMFGYDQDGQLVWETADPVAGNQGSRALELVGDELYTTRWDGHTYQRYARQDGAWIATRSSKQFPNDIALGPDGNIYVISGDGSDKGIHRYATATQLYIDEFVDWDSDGMVGLAFGPHDGYLYVCGGAKIKRYDNAGTLVEPLFATAGNTLIHLVWRDGYLYASDLGPGFENDGTIQRFDTSGNALGTVIVPGAGGLDQPWGFGFTPQGDILVCDYNPDRIVRRYNGITGTYAGDFADPPYNCTPWDVVIWEIPSETPSAGTLIMVQ